VIETLTGAAWWIVGKLLAIPSFLWRWIKREPTTAIPILYAIARAFGITIETGEKGVLFVFGRATKELEPGFHWQIPWLRTARRIRVRSMTMSLQNQDICSADGLVYRVDVNVVYRVDDAITAATGVDDLAAALHNVLPIAAHKIVRRAERAELREQSALNEQLKTELQALVGRWGVFIEAAGFQTIAPTHQTLRLTQQALTSRERQKTFNILVPEVGVAVALGLLGSSRILTTGHSAACRRQRMRRLGSKRTSALQSQTIKADEARPPDDAPGVH
jgi:hypothetical protein